MEGWQALVLAVVQGVTELFPISSLAHAVLLPPLLGWHWAQRDETFLPFLVVLHLGTAAALLLFFWRDWRSVAQILAPGTDPKQRRASLRLFALLALGTLPAAVIGIILERRLRELFGGGPEVALFLMLNGGVLFLGERLRRGARSRDLDTLRWWEALLIGGAQALALVPGFSRSGCTMVAGLLVGLRHEAAAHYSFLLATPIILGAAVLEVPPLLRASDRGPLGLAIGAGLAAGVTAWMSTALLMRYFRRHEFHALDAYAYYCWAAGALALGVLLLRG
jgi:undecaprenyl-diphosphatase